ncbi:conserved hypothetical protein [Methylocella tundrae]|uniref:Ava_C0101 and related proteins n=1 Tax=Methylocella tundrae TaxID=227605 RepID=A0A8B6MBH9_METTU|nr:DUF5996 family protein [Methylocella tundrae]VTZ27289.1 conserved hypothetical protein [Methylocella tundrae]VTZ52274.1 conserved hypothetical protein [Methylocella tundrae]
MAQPGDVLDASNAWPELDYAAGRETYETLHLLTQIVGKIRLSRTPWLNHSWHVTLYVCARGLTTSPIPYGEGTFEICFDFIAHRLIVETSDGQRWHMPLRSSTIADLYATLMAGLAGLGVRLAINETPNELPDPIRFSEDRLHGHYDPDQAHRFWEALLRIDRVFKLFRTGFLGKCSPVHFFWGSFDLAVTRFSGRRAPLHPGGVPYLPDSVVREAYSHEVSSAGFWPGGGGIDYPAFYSYAYPAPPGFSSAVLRPQRAFFSTDLQEFILPYDCVRTAPAPDEALLQFLQSTYDAAAVGAAWDRASLECGPGEIGRPRAISAPL